MFASLGFSIIASSVVMFLQTPSAGSANGAVGFVDQAVKPTFALVAGTIVDVVAALFFVQSNKARQLMTEFFDKLRSDRKLDEALKLAHDIQDTNIASRLKAIIALNFSEVPIDNKVLMNLLPEYKAPPEIPSAESKAEVKLASVPRAVDAAAS